MNFKGHFTGSLITAGFATGVALFIEKTSPEPIIMSQAMTNLDLIKVFGITCFMGLFPDLDTASLIQRWFYRFMLAFLAYCLIEKKMDYFAAGAILSVLPLVDKHRGWTHWKVTPWVLPVLIIGIFQYMRAEIHLLVNFKLERISNALEEYWFFVLCSVLGHYTHLVLDSKLGKKSYLKWMNE